MKLNALTRERGAAVLTIKQLSDLSGVSEQTIWQIEGGRRPRQTTIQRLAKGLNISPKKLRELRTLEVNPERRTPLSDISDAELALGEE